MIIICDSIKKKELEPLNHAFPLDVVIESARKVRGGLYDRLQGWNEDGTILLKRELTSRYGAGRIVFVFRQNTIIYIPGMLRLKTDKVGANMTVKAKRKVFEKEMKKNYEMIKMDLKSKNYQEIANY